MNAVAEEMKPLDFSILDGFEIGHGAGRYYNHRVCIMSALFLVTEIAAGRVTDEALAAGAVMKAMFAAAGK